MGNTRTEQTPAERLLEALGPVTRFHEDVQDVGDFGLPARALMEDYLEPYAIAGPQSRLGPLERVHAFWFAGMSCDGCSISVLGATAPSVEDLLTGRLPGVPQVVLHHPALNLEAGAPYMRAAEDALRGTLDAPYVLIYEGSITDETIAHAQHGYWVAQGEEPWGPGGAMRPVSTPEWVARLAPAAAAVIAIGTC